MSLVQTILVLGGIPLAIYAVVSVLTLRRRPSRALRYRPGQDWDYPPVWWVANPAGAGNPQPVDASTGNARTAKGGARGSW